LAKATKNYVAVYNEKPVGFIALIHSPYKKSYWRVSRLVILPDYQGIGIGTRFLTAIAEYWTAKTGKPFFIVTSNPQLKNLHKHSKWRLTRIGHSTGQWNRRKDLRKSLSKNRLTLSFRFLPAQPETRKPKQERLD
jgi:GNAT superfamily N-acetyltransferase